VGLLGTAKKAGKKIYHGTSDLFDDFDVSKSADGSIWFTDNKSKILSGDVGASTNGNVMERIIDEDKLKLATWDDTDKYSTGQLIDQGFDGVKMVEDGENTYQIFNPEKLSKVESLNGPQGLLDMDTPSRMARATEQGFDVDNPVYHGTTASFSAFDPNMAGSSTGAKDAAKGMWFADSPIATKYFGGYDDQIPTKEYSDYILAIASKRNSLEKMRDNGEISASEYFRKGRELTASSPAEPVNKFTEGYEDGSQIMPAMVRGLIKEVDAANYSPDRFLEVAKSAKDDGFDGVRFIDINDMDEAPVKHSQTVMFDPSNIRSTNAAFDPAKTGSSNLLASNPVATTSAGILGAIAAAQSNDTYADYSPSNLARLQNDDVGSYQAAQSPQLARAAGLMGQVNKRGVDDPLMGFVAPRIPSELMDKIAYNDRRGITDYLKASAGLIGLY
jgi:hypothetical protein